MSILKYYKKNSAGMVYGAIWGAVAVALGTVINSLIDAISVIMDFLVQVIKYIVIFPAMIPSWLNLSGTWLWVIAIGIGILAGPFALFIFKKIYGIIKKSPV